MKNSITRLIFISIQFYSYGIWSIIIQNVSICQLLAKFIQNGNSKKTKKKGCVSLEHEQVAWI